MKPDEIISIESSAFRALIEKVIEYVKQMHHANDKTDLDWIDTTEAMRILNISSPTSLARLRNNGSIVFTRPSRKILLYSKRSLVEYLDKHTKHKF